MDQVHAERVPIDTSVSIVVDPWRMFIHAAWWNGQPLQNTTGVVSAALPHSGLLGGLLGGLLVTRVPIRIFTLGNLLGQGTGLALVATATDPIGILVGAGLFGATVGNLLMLHPLLLAEAFGVRDYPRIFSLSNALTTVGVAGGPALLGFLYDFQGYGFAYMTAACLSLAASIVILAAGAVPLRQRQDRRDDRQDCRQDEGIVGGDKRDCKQEERAEECADTRAVDR